MIKSITRLKKKNASGRYPCQICERIGRLHTHHIQGRKIPNYNNPSNLASICPNCHDSVHSGEIIIEGNVMTSDGPKLIWRKAGESSLTGMDAKPNLYKNKSN
jgi:uncharacterized protein YlaI